MKVNFVIRGEPRGKERPRFYNKRAYTPQKTKEYENKVKTGYMLQCPKGYFGTCPIKAKMTAFYPIPESWSKSKKARAIQGEVVPTVKPDCDNVIKAILDSLNGVAYKDDNQVVEINFIKKYSLKKDARIEVELWD